MRQGIAESRYNALMRSISKDRFNHISANDLRFQSNEQSETKKYQFDIRNHYKKLKENHPLSQYVELKKESSIKKTYISMSDSQSNLRTAIQTPKHTSVKKYGKEKLTKFKKGQQINFNELYDKIKNIGS